MRGSSKSYKLSATYFPHASQILLLSRHACGRRGERGGSRFLPGVPSSIPIRGRSKDASLRCRNSFSRRSSSFRSRTSSDGGTRISIRSSKSLFPIEEHIRLLPLFLEGRPVLRQPIRTQSGKYIGRCMDIQFDTRYFMVEWLFPGECSGGARRCRSRPLSRCVKTASLSGIPRCGSRCQIL